jgi:2-polyprenyl-6-hydroxyphenyl methylase/3-demethylubiquinone-9 3-methyltransferase
MSEHNSLLRQETHFAFGKNWADYATLVGEAQIREAERGLQRLLDHHVAGSRFLDIGCGSGIHSLAALRLGAAEVVAVDIDPDSVATTRALLEKHAPGGPWKVTQTSVFELRSAEVGQFDVVYSWGVLHHTGDMRRALRAAAGLVAPGGRLVFALYRRTALCWFWKLEKRWYARAGRHAQAGAQWLYLAVFRLLKGLLRRRDFERFLREYQRERGMDLHHDVHDWLGGWPYESISATELARFMSEQLAMQQRRAIMAPGGSTGILGSGCDEYVYSAP